MTDQKKKRRRSSSAFTLDKQIEQTCSDILKSGKTISARSVAEKLGKAPSTITRDPIRSKIIAEFKRQQMFIGETLQKQAKRSRAKDTEVIAALKAEIEMLRRQNNALLFGFKAQYNVIREVGGKDAFVRFLATAEAIQLELLALGAVDD